jgi:ABC-type lipoprotein export system ATPase subunit
MSNNLLKLDGVTKSFLNPEGTALLEVLKGVSCEVDTGETVAIVGPSGSGKTTLLNLIGALDTPTEGTIEFCGHALESLNEKELAQHRNQHVGFIFQSHYLLPQLSVLENVLVPILPFQKVSKEHIERAKGLLERVGLQDRMDHRPGQLSGGECQRVAVVRSLANEPQLLLADEPTGALDQLTADTLTALLLELNQELKTALIVVTHAQSLADRMQRSLRIRDGLIQED